MKSILLKDEVNFTPPKRLRNFSSPNLATTVIDINEAADKYRLHGTFFRLFDSRFKLFSLENYQLH